jgi:hypothetical protein
MILLYLVGICSNYGSQLNIPDFNENVKLGARQIPLIARTSTALIKKASDMIDYGIDSALYGVELGSTWILNLMDINASRYKDE